MKRSGRLLWLVIGVFILAAGCALDQRKFVVRSEEVAGQNDSDWKILKAPQPASERSAR